MRLQNIFEIITDVFMYLNVLFFREKKKKEKTMKAIRKTTRKG